MRAVNLLPSAHVEVEPRTMPKWLPFVGAAIVPIIVINLLFTGYTNAHNALKVQQVQLTAAQAEVAKLAPAVAATAPDTSVLVAARTARQAALDDALAKEVDWSRTLGDLARVLPANVWLTDMTATSPTPGDGTAVAAAIPGTATGFTISGYAYSADDVAAALERLQLLPTLTDVTLGSTSTSVLGTKTVVSFSVSATLTPVYVKGAPAAATTTTTTTTVTTP